MTPPPRTVQQQGSREFDMETIISAGIALLAQVAPLLSSASSVGSAISFISSILVPAVTLAKDEIPVIKGVISTLRGNGSVTEQQMNDLDALDAQCDTLLDAAIAKAEAADNQS
jgi:hypothetical protein